MTWVESVMSKTKTLDALGACVADGEWRDDDDMAFGKSAVEIH